MLEVIKQIFPLFSVIILTYLLKYFKVIDKQKLSPSVTQIAFDIVMPVLLFEVFSAAELDFSYLLLPAITIVFSVIAVIFILGFSKLNRIENKLLIFVAFTGLNVAPIYPLVEFNYSTDVFSKFVLMDLGALIILFTLTINIASIGSDVKIKFDIKDALKHIFWNPVMAAIAIGLIVNLLNLKTPDLVLNTTSYISASFGFLVSFIVGLNFELPKEWNIFAKVSLYYLS
ncbi:hypothetical protein KC909_03870, partial [Candidatus Dojkabacteria bacterium]|nr:hypothetical protein [Candidatus Dojkabacteria bacterium]